MKGKGQGQRHWVRVKVKVVGGVLYPTESREVQHGDIFIGILLPYKIIVVMTEGGVMGQSNVHKSAWPSGIHGNPFILIHKQ